MKQNRLMVAAVAAGLVCAVVAQDKVQVKIPLPKPHFGGTPKELKGTENLEPPRDGKPREPIFVPAGCDKLLSRDCKVTSSDPDPIVGELSYITDGDKEHDSAAYVELAPGTQWIQVDLGGERELHAICVWHFFGEMVQLPLRGGRVYRDVICQISNDPDFVDGVVTVFNNDHDNSSRLGIGKDKEYLEINEGRPFPVNAVKGRYVRFYSRGNTSNEMNHYIEIEVYGKGD
ncbi:MAG: discoidin domain-containing protein [Kiritimatiellaeota bacterium]|nr:discoidin domain-containing protein [Kiritimatiellota bacterium]